MVLKTILVVDDEPLIRHCLEEMLKRNGYLVESAETGRAALSLLHTKSYDLVLTDMRLPDSSGLDILKKAKAHSPSTVVLVMTAFGTIENAVEAMRLGAFTYLLKPFSVEVIEAVIEKVKEHVALVEQNTYLKESSATQVKVIAESPPMRKILEEVGRIAKSQATVLIHGASGTGKEVIAGAIHAHSLRAQKPYIRVNCAAIPDTLLESEFFGHEKGAFTGATTRRLGRFELAHEGTLLLDEVTEIPIHLQPKLLRVIQEQEVERVGGSRPVPVDVRLIATSNRNLKEAISAKLFREDLYYRLNVVPLYLPTLHERQEDILPLTRYFLARYCQENRKPPKKLSPEAEKKLCSYPWPGNIRELSNVLERVVVLDLGPELLPDHFALGG